VPGGVRPDDLCPTLHPGGREVCRHPPAPWSPGAAQVRAGGDPGAEKIPLAPLPSPALSPRATAASPLMLASIGPALVQLRNASSGLSRRSLAPALRQGRNSNKVRAGARRTAASHSCRPPLGPPAPAPGRTRNFRARNRPCAQLSSHIGIKRPTKNRDRCERGSKIGAKWCRQRDEVPSAGKPPGVDINGGDAYHSLLSVPYSLTPPLKRGITGDPRSPGARPEAATTASPPRARSSAPGRCPPPTPPPIGPIPILPADVGHQRERCGGCGGPQGLRAGRGGPRVDRLRQLLLHLRIPLPPEGEGRNSRSGGCLARPTPPMGLPGARPAVPRPATPAPRPPPRRPLRPLIGRVRG